MNSKPYEFTLEDFKTNLMRIINPPLFESLARLLMPSEMQSILADKDHFVEARRVVGIISAMTPLERRTPKVIDYSRRTRIARGTGVQEREVDAVVTRFEYMALVMRAVHGRSSVSSRIEMLPDQ